MGNITGNENITKLPKNNKNGDRIGGQTRALLLLESSKCLCNKWKYEVGYIEKLSFAICSQRKNYLKAYVQKNQTDWN